MGSGLDSRSFTACLPDMNALDLNQCVWISNANSPEDELFETMKYHVPST